MAGIQQVSFTTPYSAEEAEIEQRLRMAELLREDRRVQLVVDADLVLKLDRHFNGDQP